MIHRLISGSGIGLALNGFVAAASLAPDAVSIENLAISTPPAATVVAVGPGLDGVAVRWIPEELHTVIINPQVVNPQVVDPEAIVYHPAVFTDETVIPGFYPL